MSISQRTILGVIWNFTEQLLNKGITGLVTIGLAYFLVPADFGLLAMIAVFIAVGSNLMESGFRQAIIRMPEISQKDLNTAFISNVFLGLLSFLFLFVLAPYISDFYNESRLTVIVRVASLAIVINSFQVIQLAILSRNLNFKAQMVATIPATVLSGLLALMLAYLNFGVWALIAQTLSAALITTLILWINSSWRPSFSFSRESFDNIFGFGSKLFLSSILDITFKNLYVIVIAKLFSAKTAGLYFFSDKLKDVVVRQIVSSIQNVTYPALATIQDDQDRLKLGYKKIISVSTFLLFPIMIFLAALSDQIFETFLPAKWVPGSPYFQFICLSGVLAPLHSINLNVLKVKGRSDLFLYLEIVKKIMSSIVLFASIKFGIWGILCGQILNSILTYIPNSFFSVKLINYPVKEQVRDFMPALCLSGAVGLLMYYGNSWLAVPPIVKLIIVGGLGSVAYLGLAYILNLKSFHLTNDILLNRLLKKKK